MKIRQSERLYFSYSLRPSATRVKKRIHTHDRVTIMFAKSLSKLFDENVLQKLNISLPQNIFANCLNLELERLTSQVH